MFYTHIVFSKMSLTLGPKKGYLSFLLVMSLPDLQYKICLVYRSRSYHIGGGFTIIC